MNQSKNVLLSCAGRRNYLVRYFKAALNGDGAVLAADASSDAPALREADGCFLVPPLSDPGAMDALIDICADNGVRLVISLNDYELPLLAQNRDRFLDVGTIPVVSSPSVVEACFDKWATMNLLRGMGVRVAATYLTVDDARQAAEIGSLTYPVIVKPRWGTASISVDVAHDEMELCLAYELTLRRIARMGSALGRPTTSERTVIIQEHLQGQEHGIDIVNDLSGNHVSTLARRKLTMRAGETERAITVSDPAFDRIGALIGSRLGHIGNLDCDVFLQNGELTVLEMNPRFGGGYPFSHVAGSNIPAAVVAWASGRPIDAEWLRSRAGVKSAKFDDLVITSAS